MHFFAYINFAILVLDIFWTWNCQGLFLALWSTISEGFKNIWFQKNILKNPKVPKTAPKKLVKMVSDFSWTWNFQEWFLASLSTISEVLKKFYCLVYFCQFSRYQKIQFFVKFWRFQIFPGKTAVYVSLEHQYLISDRKLSKSNVGKYHNSCGRAILRIINLCIINEVTFSKIRPCQFSSFMVLYHSAKF